MHNKKRVQLVKRQLAIYINIYTLLWHDKLVGGFNPIEKYLSNWKTSPSRGENKKCLKPPPSKTSYMTVRKRDFVVHFFPHLALGYLWILVDNCTRKPELVSSTSLEFFF